jgi:Bacterial membrane protein YfhO
MRFSFLASIAALGAIILIAIGHSDIRMLRLAPYLVPFLIFICIFPVLHNMRPYWSDPDMMRGTYDSQGLPLKSHGHLRAKDIFNRVESCRPARQAPARPMALSWRGYIDGSYMTGDFGGVRSVATSAVDRDPGLQRLMQKPSTILSVECSENPAVCTGTKPIVRLSPELSGERATRYSRNSVEYDVQLQKSALLVENEIYAPGWHGVCETHGQQLQCKRVNGALRGWVLPAGNHHIRLWYLTPRLHLGIALTCIAFLAWIGLVAHLVWANTRIDRITTLAEIRAAADFASHKNRSS